MPKSKHPPPYHSKSRPRLPSPRVAEHVDRAHLDAIVARWVSDPHERDFVARCLADEGPAHHRGATFAILTLLERLLERIPETSPRPETAPTAPVALHLPPHLADDLDPHDGHFPLAMPTGALRDVAADPREAEAMIDSLTDGPPHHALANALTVAMLDEALRRLGAKS